MAINDEIAAGGRPIQFENPLNNMVKFSNIQNDMANMALHRQKMATDAASTARQNELNNYLGSGGRDPDRIYQLGGQEALNHINQAESARITGLKVSGETLDATMNRNKGILQDYVDTPKAARQWLYMQFIDPVMKSTFDKLGVSFDQAASRIPDDPAEFGKWKEQSVVGMEKHLQNTAVKNTTNLGNRYEQRDAQGRLVGQPMIIGATPKEKYDFGPKYIAEVAERDRTADDIKKTEALYNSSSGAPMREVYGSQLKDFYTRLDVQDKSIAGMKAEEAALKQNPDAKLAAINDYYARINNGEDPNSPSMKVRKGQIDFNQTRPEPTPFMVLDKNGNLTAVDKRTILPVGTLKGVGKPQQNIVQFGPDGLPIQDKALPAHAIEAQGKNNAARANIQSSLKQAIAHPEAFGLQNMLPEAITQRLDPAGVTARAGVANIGSMIVHDRSGAAVTVGEVPRLRPFIPNITTDDAATIVQKLRDLDRIMGEMNLEMSKSFAAQGYNTGSPAGATPPAEPTLHKHPKGTGLDKTNPRLQ